MTSIRSASYSVEEDIQLCHVYLDVSQNPIIGINQSGDQFWARVCTEYAKAEISQSQPRPRRSLQTRMSTILTAVSKFRGCVNQIENQNPSGASEYDILNQAKVLLTQDVKYKKGFKYDHVWHLMKGMEKFSSNHSNRAGLYHHDSSQTAAMNSSSSLQDDSSPIPGMNSFDLNSSGEEPTLNVSQRPMGNKKAKRIQQSAEQFKKLTEQNERLIQAITKGTADRNAIQRKKLEVRQMREENKILLVDLSSVTDPFYRDFIEKERVKIMNKREQANRYEEHGEGSGSQYRASQYRDQNDQGEEEHDQDQGTQEETHQDFSQYYDYLNGPGTNFPGF